MPQPHNLTPEEIKDLSTALTRIIKRYPPSAALRGIDRAYAAIKNIESGLPANAVDLIWLNAASLGLKRSGACVDQDIEEALILLDDLRNQ